jgi:hypothetical protein
VRRVLAFTWIEVVRQLGVLYFAMPVCACYSITRVGFPAGFFLLPVPAANEPPRCRGLRLHGGLIFLLQ